jgi:Raf kinase inhibitor-like YbhB/YbcL family protein
VIYKIPADARALDEHLSIEPRPAAPAGALQGANSWSSGQKIGYRGPAPPPGKVHHYHFRIYALDTALPLESGLTKPELVKAMQGHILAEGQLIGTYKR